MCFAFYSFFFHRPSACETHYNFPLCYDSCLPTDSASPFLPPSSVQHSESKLAYKISINNKDTPNVHLQNNNQRGNFGKSKSADTERFCSPWGSARVSKATQVPTEPSDGTLLTARSYVTASEGKMIASFSPQRKQGGSNGYLSWGWGKKVLHILSGRATQSILPVRSFHLQEMT